MGKYKKTTLTAKDVKIQAKNNSFTRKRLEHQKSYYFRNGNRDRCNVGRKTLADQYKGLAHQGGRSLSSFKFCGEGGTAQEGLKLVAERRDSDDHSHTA
jgi:hypothetical protein